MRLLIQKIMFLPKKNHIKINLSNKGFIFISNPLGIAHAKLKFHCEINADEKKTLKNIPI